MYKYCTTRIIFSSDNINNNSSNSNNNYNEGHFSLDNDKRILTRGEEGALLSKTERCLKFVLYKYTTCSEHAVEFIAL